jgi:hypothetical protein
LVVYDWKKENILFHVSNICQYLGKKNLERIGI